jgi:4-hydroxybenzoate polyprenyltransferase
VLLLLGRCAFVLANTVLSDLRDAEADRKAGFRTLATSLGEEAARRIALGAALVSAASMGALAAWPSVPAALVLVDGLAAVAYARIAWAKPLPPQPVLDLIAGWPLAVVLLLG